MLGCILYQHLTASHGRHAQHRATVLGLFGLPQSLTYSRTRREADQANFLSSRRRH
jgi:hypothetical protein